jgi:hypothetical protein
MDPPEQFSAEDREKPNTEPSDLSKRENDGYDLQL